MMKGDILKNRMLAVGIDPKSLEGVDFNSMESLEKLAEKIMPWIIKNNPNVRNLLRQNSHLAGDKQKEVVEVIDKI